MYNKYAQAQDSANSINKQISFILKDISKKLSKSHDLFNKFHVAQSVELGEKIIKIATSFAGILNDGIQETLSQEHSTTTKEALEELRQYFVCIPVLITKYVVSRDEELYKRIQDSIQAMATSWQNQK